ncbi:MAG: hypothetical protein KIT11_03500 [Fimbriimonadaceae bacterium]|nr:hypothetical protein [Fimbriimonadaceae bacterium]QYK57038.1 MAG: hypothetical protein KF733_06025 [Fimbriimonadaceae bacterium]
MRILAVGDSITAGAGSPGGYRTILQQRLGRADRPFDFLGDVNENSAGMAYPQHEGHGGWTISDLADGNPSDLGAGNVVTWMRRYQPTHVLVMAGTNDNPFMDRQTLTGLYERLLDRIFSVNRNVKVALACIPKSRQSVTKRQAYERMAWEVVRTVVVRRRVQGYQISFANCYSPIDPNRHLADNYHPNRDGYVRIALAFEAALRALDR